MKKRSIFESFYYAISGIIYCFKTQRNIRIHCVMALGALALGLFCGFSKVELTILCLTITMVITAEIINTAIEKAVDITAPTYHPLAKIAKDVAAGAVLLTAVNSIVVGYILFFSNVRFIGILKKLFLKVTKTPFHVFFISLIIILMLVFFIRAYLNKGGKKE